MTTAGDEEVARLRAELDSLRAELDTARESLARREAFLGAVAERGPLGILLIDPQTRRFVEFNDAACASLGYSRDEFALLTLDDLQAARTPEQTAERIAQVQEHGRLEFSTRYRTKDGGSRTFWVSVRVVQLEGRPHHASVWFDLTEKERAREALRVREEVFSSIAAQASDSIALIEAQTGRFVEFNDSAHRDLGYSRAEFAVLGIGDIQAEHSADQVRANIERIRDAGGAEFETRHRRRDGEVRTVLVRARQLTLRDQSFIAAVWTDITERKAMELELRERLKELTCLRKVQHLLEQDPALDVLCLQVLQLVIPAMQQPEVAVASIEVDGHRWLSTREPVVSRASLQSEILVRHGVRGVLTVHYTVAGKFLGEEQDLLDAVGRAVGMFLERKEADEARRRSLAEIQMLSLIIEQSPNPVIVTDVDARITYVNEAFERTTGYGRDEVMGKNPNLLRSGKTPSSTYAAMWSALSKGEPWRGEFINLRKNGEEEIESAVLLPLRTGGVISGYVAVKEDITERKRAQDELRRLSLVVEQSPESIVITDLDGSIQYVNDAFVRTSGYERAEALGRNPSFLQSKKTPRSTYTALWQALTRGQSWRGELVNRRADGTEYVELAVIAPLRDPERGITQYVAIKQDITQLKLLSAELEQQRQQTETADAANRAKSAFLANMSHEMRTPMNAILGLTHLLRRETASPAHREQLDKISGAADHLLSIINDLLDLSKIEAGKVELESVPFDARRLVFEVCDLLAAKVDDKGLQMLVDVTDLPAALRGDGFRVRQILLNLLSNAVKFTDAGHVQVRCRMIAASRGSLRVRFEVTDTGIGLSDEQQRRLFRSFEQADASTSRKYGGTGLGLSISRHLAQLMGGEVGCDSAVGSGSTFWFEAPFGAATPSEVESSRDGSAERACAALGRSRRVRVLLAEDNDLNAEVAQALLHNVGFEVDRVRDGEEAVARAEGQFYDLVLMDVHMPRLDGLQATARIRALPGWKQTPILAATANAFDDERAECRRVGMDDFVLKPVVPELLYQAIVRWLPHDQPAPSRRGSRRPAPREEEALRAKLERLDGVNLEQGLLPAMGQLSVYLRLLRLFCTQHGGDPTKFGSPSSLMEAPPRDRLSAPRFSQRLVA